jgi:peptidoglycan/LPS O-acetylase OafA/YrhL
MSFLLTWRTSFAAAVALSPSFASKLKAADNRPSGFDYLRISLAMAVVVIHIPPIVYGMAFAYPFWMPWLRPIYGVVLPSFFALSGYLVAGSLLRSQTLVTFFGLRILRIVPALSVEVVLSALILGPIFTDKSLSEYFTDPLFFRYFFNLIGHIQYVLPGVFSTNPFPDKVNLQLWTVPSELKCYVLIGLMSLFLIFRNRFYLIVFAIGFNVLIFALYGFLPGDGRLNVPPVVLINSFLAGVTLFVFRDRVVCSPALFIASTIASAAFLATPNGDYLMPIPIAYATAYIGVLNPRRNGLIFSGDYSYGIYLYGFPIQQAVAAAGGAYKSWTLNLAVALPAVLAVAWMSWWLIERPSLGLRKFLPLTEGAFINIVRRIPFFRRALPMLPRLSTPASYDDL